MTVDSLIEACARLSVFHPGFTCKDGQHDLTHAVLELQICLEEMSKLEQDKVYKIIGEL